MASSEIQEIDERIASAKALSQTDIKHAITAFQLLYERSKNISYLRGIAASAHGLADCFDRSDSPYNTIELCKIAYPLFISVGDTDGEARCYLLISKSYTTLGDYSRQAEYLFMGLELAIATKNLLLQQKFYNNISNYYQFHLNDIEKCLEYMNISTEISIKIHDNRALLTNYCNLGIIYNYKKEYDKSLEYLKLAEEINTKYVNDDTLRCYYIIYTGTVYHNRGKDDFALKCFLEVIEISKAKGLWILFGEGLLMAGQSYGVMGEFEKAVDILNEGIAIMQEKNIKRLVINLYSVLSDIYEQRGDYKEALNYYEKYRSTRIEQLSIMNEKNLEHIKFLNHLETAQKESLILKEKNSELYGINELLIETDKEKNDFLGVVVHDLKNPLTNIILIAGNLKKNFEKITDEKKVSSLEKIYLSSERMIEIIDNLLDINKIESGNLNLKISEINLNHLILKIISDFEIYSNQKNIKVIVNSDADVKPLSSDEMVVKEILMNLISNALKYSHKNSEVNINISALSEGKTEIKISDKGLGIKDEEKERIFQKFAKLSNKPTAGENSTGLGLSIVKKLTELCGGNISFDSEFGKGTTFTLVF